MAGQGSKLASGWLELTVSTDGAQKSITDTVMPAAVSAGDAAGASLGGRMLGTLKKALPVAAVAAAVGGVAKGLYNVGAVFDDVSDTIRVGTGATGANLAGLESVAKKVGTTIPTSFEAAGKTVADLNTRMGLSGRTLQTVAQQYLESGRILGETVDVNTTTAAFTAFGIKGKAVEGAMDDLFRVSQATGVGMNQLAATAKDAAPVMTNLGFSFSESAALVGSLDKAGLNSSKMVMSLSSGMVKLAKSGEAPATAFRRTVGELQGFVASGNTAAAIDLAGKVFGTRGATQFVAAIKSGTLNLNDLMGAAGTTDDTILGVAKQTSDAAETWQILKNKAVAALQPIGSLLFNGVGLGLAKVLDLVNWVSDAFDVVKGSFTGLGSDMDMGPMTNMLIDVGSTLRTVWDSITPLFQQVWAALSPLIGEFLKVAPSVSPFMIILKALMPVLPMIAGALGQLAGVLGGVLNTAFTTLIPPIMQLASVVSDALVKAVMALLPAITTLIPIVVQVASILGNTLGQVIVALVPVITILADLIGQLVPAVMPLIAAVLGLVDPIGQLILAVAPLVGILLPPLIGLFAAILKPILALVPPIVGLLVPALSFLANVLSVVIGWVAQTLGWFIKLVTGNKEVGAQFMSVWNGVMGFFGGIGRFFANIWNGLITGIAKFVVRVFDFFGSIPKKIGALFAGAGKWLWDAGKNIIDGLINGATSLLRNIGRFFLDVLPGWIVGPFKAVLGIHSPSTVFAGFGENTMQGYIEGVSSMDRKVKDTVARTARFDPPTATVSSGLSAALAAGGRDGVFHLYDSDGVLLGTMRGQAQRVLQREAPSRVAITSTVGNR